MTSDAPGLPATMDLRPCDAAAHGAFIRRQSRGNFFDLMRRTVGWNEERHRQEPQRPQDYTMVYEHDRLIGFFALRYEASYAYLTTIQLVPDVRGRGLGTALMHHVEALARERSLASVRLRVFTRNRASSLYRRLGYRPLDGDHHAELLAKDLQ